MVTRSENIDRLVLALCKAQLAFDPIYKESENPAFVRKGKASKYADLFSLVTATRKHLNANGLAVMQFPTVTLEGKNLIVTTILAHESGQWISSEVTIPAVDERGFTAHSIGKAMTYARRYSWQSIIGAVAEDDDDGNDASGQGTHEEAQAVGESKKKALEAKLGKKAPENGANSATGASLFYAKQPSGQYAVSGDKALMKPLWSQFKATWSDNGQCYLVNEEQLEVIKWQCEQGKVSLAVLKGPDANSA